MRKKVASLFAANVATFVVIGLSFIAYSRLLSAAEFGLYAVALSATSFLSLILDGGLKTTVIKLDRDLTDGEECGIAAMMLLVSVVLISVLLLGQQQLLSHHPGIKQDVKFIVFFVGIALFFYPFVTLPTAKLERDLEYGHIAWIESSSMLLERAAPALFLIFAHTGVYSFVWALLLSRVFRTSVLARFHALDLRAASVVGAKSTLRLMREGSWIQAGTISSVLRDNLHTLLIGPLYGKQWIGYYAWAFQICLMSSQVFSQISARISLPVLAQTETFRERWPKCLYQVRILAIVTIPLLCAVWFLLPDINHLFFEDKWKPALVLIPLLFARMVPGLATTPLAPMIMVHKGGRAFAFASFSWTIAEMLGAALLLVVIGPTGLAWSSATVIWIGLWIMVRALNSETVKLAKDIAQQLFWRPSFVFMGGMLIAASLLLRLLPDRGFTLSCVLASLLVLCSFAMEPEVRQLLPNAKR